MEGAKTIIFNTTCCSCATWQTSSCRPHAQRHLERYQHPIKERPEDMCTLIFSTLTFLAIIFLLVMYVNTAPAPRIQHLFCADCYHGHIVTSMHGYMIGFPRQMVIQQKPLLDFQTACAAKTSQARQATAEVCLRDGQASHALHPATLSRQNSRFVTGECWWISWAASSRSFISCTWKRFQCYNVLHWCRVLYAICWHLTALIAGLQGLNIVWSLTRQQMTFSAWQWSTHWITMILCSERWEENTTYHLCHGLSFSSGPWGKPIW